MKRNNIYSIIDENDKSDYQIDSDTIIENMHFGLPGIPGIPGVCVKFPWPVGRRCSPSIPGIPGIAFDVPDIPSFNSMFNSIKNDIKRYLIDPIISAFNEILEKVKTGINNLLEKVKASIMDMIEKMTNGLKKFYEILTSAFTTLIDSMAEFFKSFMAFFSNFSNRFVKMAKGLGNVFTGALYDAPRAIGGGLYTGFKDTGELFSWVGEYLISNLLCGIHYIQNLHKCIFYYAVDAVAKLFYSPVTIWLWLLWEFGGTDLYKTEKEIWNTIYTIDREFYNIAGFHFAHYPKGIMNQCYNCKRLRVLALKNKSAQINYDLNTNIPNSLNYANNKIRQGGSDFLSGFL